MALLVFAALSVATGRFVNRRPVMVMPYPRETILICGSEHGSPLFNVEKPMFKKMRTFAIDLQGKISESKDGTLVELDPYWIEAY